MRTEGEERMPHHRVFPPQSVLFGGSASGARCAVSARHARPSSSIRRWITEKNNELRFAISCPLHCLEPHRYISTSSRILFSVRFRWNENAKKYFSSDIFIFVLFSVWRVASGTSVGGRGGRRNYYDWVVQLIIIRFFSFKLRNKFCATSLIINFLELFFKNCAVRIAMTTVADCWSTSCKLPPVSLTADSSDSTINVSFPPQHIHPLVLFS